MLNDELKLFFGETFWSSIRICNTEMKIRRAFERLSVAYGVKAILIDEAQSMCLLQRNRSPSDHLNSLKCLAEEIGVLIYLFGTYDLLEIWNHSQQLNRRTRLIHIERYNAEIATDRLEYFSILKQLGRCLPLEDGKILSANANYILQITNGVFGEVEALLERARDYAAAVKSVSVTFEHIKLSVYSPSQLQRLKYEIDVGEARIAGKSLRDTKPGSSRETRASPKSMPGRRNPKRDPCGETQ